VPRSAQVVAAARHAPVASHTPLQQSALNPQVAPVPRHAAVHTGTPAALLVHVPRQQSASLAQIAPGARQGPAPKLQRPSAVMHVPQHCEVDASSSSSRHESPVARQLALWSSDSQVPSGAQVPEQQSLFVAQGRSSVVHRGAPQTPAWQPIEQQSSARVQGCPSAAQ
jgi:hypothetical protein